MFELTHTCFIPDHRHRSEWVCEDWLVDKVDWSSGSEVSLCLLRLVTPCQCPRLLPGSGTLPCPSASSPSSFSLVLWAWDDRLFLSSLFGVWAHCTACGSLKVTVLLPLLSECHEFRCEPPHPAQTACFRFAFCWLYHNSPGLLELCVFSSNLFQLLTLLCHFSYL